MSTMATTSFVAIEGVYVSYGDHPSDKNAKKYFNQHYGGSLPDLATLFNQPDTMTDVKASVANDVREIILEKMIKPHAIDTSDEEKAKIKPLLNDALIHVSYNDQNPTRLTKGALEQAMVTAIKDGKTPCMVKLTVGISHLHFTTAKPNYLDWSVFSRNASDAYTPPDPAAAAPAGAAPAAGRDR